MRYKTVMVKHRKQGRPFLLLLTPEEHEYLDRVVADRGGTKADQIRGHFFTKGWRRKLEELRQEQGDIAKTPSVS